MMRNRHIMDGLKKRAGALVPSSRRERVLYVVILGLILFSAWQESQIADLQERMMNVESSRYDDQLSNIRWEAETALTQNKKQDEDILFLMKRASEDRFRLMITGWDLQQEKDAAD